MPWRPQLNPITRKRWQRFRRSPRAWVSLWLLLGLYAVSLVAEGVCGRDPLYVRFNGRSCFPVFRFYPEDTFLANGRHTRPDYKAIARSPAFMANPANRMIFPLVPFGPYETADPSSIPLSDAARLAFRHEPRVGSLTLGPDYTILRSAAAGAFLGKEDADLAGRSLTNAWNVPAAFMDGLARRFGNQAAPALAATVSARVPPPTTAELSSPEFVPRAQPPASLRVILREPAGAAGIEGVVSVAPGGEPRLVTFPAWRQLDDLTRSNLVGTALGLPAGGQADLTARLGGVTYRVTATRPEVRWPHKPVPGHWLGLDNAGRDVLARILYAFRTSLTFGLILVILAMTLGALFGALQGYFGGGVDLAGQRFTEIWSALPFLYVMILLGAVYGRGFLLLLFCYALFNWIGISYYIRAEFLRLRHQPFVEAARALGLPHRTIIARHILPNALVPLITFFPFSLVGAIGSLAALDYLGFGLPPPTPSWGELLAQAQQFRWAWWLILYPSLALFAVMLLGVFVGEGVRNAYDPRPNSRYEG